MASTKLHKNTISVNQIGFVCDGGCRKLCQAPGTELRDVGYSARAVLPGTRMLLPGAPQAQLAQLAQQAQGCGSGSGSQAVLETAGERGTAEFRSKLVLRRPVTHFRLFCARQAFPPDWHSWANAPIYFKILYETL